MQKRRCPYIGLENDPSTVMSYPTLQNCCHRVEPAEAINLNYQLTHCFTFAHRHCPVLLETVSEGLPPEIAVYSTRKRATIALWLVVATGMLTAVFILLFGDWQWSGANGSFLDFNGNPTQQEVSETPGFQQMLPGSATPLLSMTPILSETITATPLPSETSAATEIPASKEPARTQTNVPPATNYPTWTAIIPPTFTPIPTRTATLFPTSTTRPTETALPTNPPLPTATARPSDTPIPTNTPRPIPSNTSIPLPTNTLRPPATSTPIPLPPTNTPNP